MKKLKSKIFWIICIILSLFLITVLFILNYQDYNRARMSVEQNLFRMNTERDKNPFKDNKQPKKQENIDKINDKDSLGDDRIDDNPKRFMDATIYTILLNDNNEIIEVISHTEDGTVKENVKEIALKIIKENKSGSVYISNLYLSDYSYNYISNNYITLIDNKEVKDRLLSTLKISIMLFILAEIIIVIISKMLSKWVIKPVEMSFNKQKQFIADASHELKTPLSVIMASAEAYEDNKKEQKWLDNIKSESNRMSKLITNLLDLAKIENENNKKVYEENNLSKIVERFILTQESLIYEKDIKLEYAVEDNIKFKCDSDEMKQLLSILLDNAIMHSSKKGHIIVNLKEEKNNILLEVKNKGLPIPKEVEEKIFERFYRVDKSRNREQNRYGLGLAIAKGIVTNHNGKIKATSKDGYTTFTINFKN